MCQNGYTLSSNKQTCTPCKTGEFYCSSKYDNETKYPNETNEIPTECDDGYFYSVSKKICIEPSVAVENCAAVVFPDAEKGSVCKTCEYGYYLNASFVCTACSSNWVATCDATHDITCIYTAVFNTTTKKCQ